MQLTAQQYAAIISRLKEQGTQQGSDKRKLSRMEVHAIVTVGTLAGTHIAGRFTSMTRDISMEGIGLLQSNPSAPGSRILVELPETPRQSLLLISQVMHTRSIAYGIYALGVHFIERAPGDLTQLWLEHSRSPIEQKRIQDSILG